MTHVLSLEVQQVMRKFPVDKCHFKGEVYNVAKLVARSLDDAFSREEESNKRLVLHNDV